MPAKAKKSSFIKDFNCTIARAAVCNSFHKNPKRKKIRDVVIKRRRTFKNQKLKRKLKKYVFKKSEIEFKSELSDKKDVFLFMLAFTSLSATNPGFT